MMDGIIVLNKPKGMTSADCVYKLRKILNEKKIGHTGTLDKEVDGVLVVCVGKATKLVEMLTNHDKIYQAKCLLGIKTKTEDIFGEIIEEKEPSVHTDKEIDEVLDSFKGIYMQIPPMYSSIKINGRKLYQYALKDIEVERKQREIKIYDIKRISEVTNEFDFTVHSSKGLYVRTLCVDIASKINELGCMKELKRIKLGDYTIDEAVNLDEVSENSVIPLNEVLNNYPKLEVKEYLVKLIKNGITLDERQTNIKEPFVCTYNNEIIALYKPVNEEYKPVIIF